MGRNRQTPKTTSPSSCPTIDMVRFINLAPLLAGLALAQDATTFSGSTYDIVPTPDAVPLDFLRDVEVPVYTATPGLDSDIIYYASATAIEAAASQQSESPLSLFVSICKH
jgi:hypothetical protein